MNKIEFSESEEEIMKRAEIRFNEFKERGHKLYKKHKIGCPYCVEELI